MFRIGHGFDAHCFQSEGHCILAGVEIPCIYGIQAHSDGDVVIHALCDALLGACALGDIGHYFSDTEERFKGADSRIFLKHVLELIQKEGYILQNIDITVIAQIPKIAPHILAMRQCLSEVLNTSIQNINIKATTTEGMGFTGREEGIACHAVALIMKKD